MGTAAADDDADFFERRLAAERRGSWEEASKVKSAHPEHSVRWLEKSGRYVYRYADGRIVQGRYRLGPGRRGPNDRYWARQVAYTVGSVEWKAEVRLRGPNKKRKNWRADVRMGLIPLRVIDTERVRAWRRILAVVQEALASHTADQVTLKSKWTGERMERSDERRRPGPISSQGKPQ